MATATAALAPGARVPPVAEKPSHGAVLLAVQFKTASPELVSA